MPTFVRWGGGSTSSLAINSAFNGKKLVDGPPSRTMTRIRGQAINGRSTAPERSMKITRIRLYRQFQPFRDGPYTCSGNRTALGFDSAIVAIDTDQDLTGWGE